MYFTRNNETSVAPEPPAKTGSSISYDHRQFLRGTTLGLRWSARAGGSAQNCDVHPGNMKTTLCVLQLEKDRECEVPNLLSGSAVAVHGEFGDVF